MQYIPINHSFPKLSYQEGLLFWENKKLAGTLAKSGYLRIKYGGVSYLAHRIVWAKFHGSVPDMHIDHINGDKLDNKIENLRLATNGQNFANSPKVRSSSGYRGVYPFRNKWKALCAEEYLGLFDTPEEAYQVFCQKAVERWGEFWDGRARSY